MTDGDSLIWMPVLSREEARRELMKGSPGPDPRPSYHDREEERRDAYEPGDPKGWA